MASYTMGHRTSTLLIALSSMIKDLGIESTSRGVFESAKEEILELVDEIEYQNQRYADLLEMHNEVMARSGEKLTQYERMLAEQVATIAELEKKASPDPAVEYVKDPGYEQLALLVEEEKKILRESMTPNGPSNKVPAVQLLRERTGWGLMRAFDSINYWLIKEGMEIGSGRERWLRDRGGQILYKNRATETWGHGLGAEYNSY